MGSVVISPNLVKKSVRINAAGEEIDPATKQVLVPVEPPYIPPPEAVEQAIAKSSGTEPVKESPISSLIQRKVSEMVEKEVAKAIEEAFKKLL